MSRDELIAALEKATGPDRALDFAILVTVAGIRPEIARHMNRADAPAYTSSIDAALALLEPGWELTISTLYGFADVELPLNDTRVPPIHVRRLDGSIPLAIVTAALSAQEPAP